MNNYKQTRLLRYFLISTVSFVFSVSCSKDRPKAVLEVTPQTIELPNDNRLAIATVTSNTRWTATLSGDDHIKISPSGAEAGTTQLKISAEPNTASQERRAEITVSAGEAVKKIPVVQPSVPFSASPAELDFETEAGSRTIRIRAAVPWEISVSDFPEWITSAEPSAGTTDATITVSVKENPGREAREDSLRINYAGTWAQITIKQSGHNNNPSAPAIRYPAHGATDISLLPEFRWKESSDPDGDEIIYTVYVSTDRENWVSLGNESGTSRYCASSLEPHTSYYLKIEAADPFGGKSYSEIHAFATGERDVYPDGGWVVYGEPSKKSSPVNLIFTGDGYLPEHYKYGGLFDQNVREGIEALFAVEPYKSYREYFTIYKLAAYSREYGVSDRTKNISKNTVFSCTLTGGTAIECNETEVFAYTKKIPGITENTLRNSAVAVIINYDGYAGTCIMWSDGKSIAMIPVSKTRRPGYENQTEYANVLIHEFGGHGWGRQADEYMNYPAAIPQAAKDELTLWQGFGCYLNISLTANLAEVPWNYLIGQNGYAHVGAYEGGYLYRYGTYRPEDVSCMDDNRAYFNSQSRYLIVKRILETAGEPFTLEGFIAKDIQKTPPQSQRTYHVHAPYPFTPLAPPVLRIAL